MAITNIKDFQGSKELLYCINLHSNNNNQCLDYVTLVITM